MLQQTTVAAVIPYYERFVTRFPTVEALAAAPLDTVLSAWAGLGYYARARNLHACAQAVAAAGGFPPDLARLQALPGIGAYTAAAIGAIAFGIPAVPVDGNVERVVARLFAIETAHARRQTGDPRRPLSGSAPTRPPVPGRATSPRRCLTWAPAFAPRPRPAAPSVPGSPPAPPGAWASKLRLPRKSPKKDRPVRYGVHFWLTDDRQTVLLRTRPAKGLLGGMTELPGTAWRDTPLDHRRSAIRCADAPVPGKIGLAPSWPGPSRLYPFRADPRHPGRPCPSDRGRGFRPRRWMPWTMRRCRRSCGNVCGWPPGVSDHPPGGRLTRPFTAPPPPRRTATGAPAAARSTRSPR